MNDKDIKNFFHNHQPQSDDADVFLLDLQQKMEAMEIVKQQYDNALRHYRIMIGVSVCGGIVIGAAIMILMILHPFKITGLGIFVAIRSFVSEWKMLFMILIATIVIVFSLLPERKRYSS